MQSLGEEKPYFVRLIDFYEQEENFYLIMDYMRGGDVLDRLYETKKYTEEDARRLTRLLLEAVGCMHSVGIAHRDLKPQNLLLTVRIRSRREEIFAILPSGRNKHQSNLVSLDLDHL